MSAQEPVSGADKTPITVGDDRGSHGSFLRVKAGDEVVWRRAKIYGPPIVFVVTHVRGKTFIAEADNGEWRLTFRKADGRVVGSIRNVFFVAPSEPGR